MAFPDVAKNTVALRQLVAGPATDLVPHLKILMGERCMNALAVQRDKVSANSVVSAVLGRAVDFVKPKQDAWWHAVMNDQPDPKHEEDFKELISMAAALGDNNLSLQLQFEHDSSGLVKRVAELNRLGKLARSGTTRRSPLLGASVSVQSARFGNLSRHSSRATMASSCAPCGAPSTTRVAPSCTWTFWRASSIRSQSPRR